MGRNHIVLTRNCRHHNALFLLNSRIPLVRTSSELAVYCHPRYNTRSHTATSLHKKETTLVRATLAHCSVRPYQSLASIDAARIAQPSEPILIPKLRIYFADFPYLRYSIGQRLFTLETCCGYGYEFARNLHTSLPILSRANASASDGTRPVPLLVVVHPISGQTDSRVHTLRSTNHLIRKDNSLRNLHW